jgi:hypothetical protein
MDLSIVRATLERYESNADRAASEMQYGEANMWEAEAAEIRALLLLSVEAEPDSNQ